MTLASSSSEPTRSRFLQIAAQNRRALRGLATAPPRLVVIGNFNAGKSTLINALLGKRLLPAALRPTTGAVIRLLWGPEDRTTVRFVDGRMKTLPGTQLLEEYAVIGAAGNSEQVEDIQVETDASLLQSGLMIVDIPGMEDDPSRYTAIFRETLLADAVLSIHDVGIQMPLSEQNFLQQELIANGCAAITIIWNKCNLLEPEQQDAAVAGAVKRLRGIEQLPLEPLRAWYRLDALPELRQRLAGGSPSAAFQTFEEDLKEALNADSLLLQQTRATRTATLLATEIAPGEAEEEPAIVAWRDTARAAAERLSKIAAQFGMEPQAAALASLAEDLQAQRGNLLMQIRQVLETVLSVRESMERSQAHRETDREQAQRDHAFVQERFATARQRQAELPSLIQTFRAEIEVSLLRSFLVRVQAVLQHLRSTADSLPAFSPQTGYQAVTALVQGPVETWKQDKTAANSAYQVLQPIAARLTDAIQAEIVILLGTVSALEGSQVEIAEEREEDPEARRILSRVVSTVSRRLIDREALLTAFLARLPTLDPAALATFKGIRREEFLPHVESLLMTTLAGSEERMGAAITTVLSSVEKSVRTFTDNALAGIEQRWNEILTPSHSPETQENERFEARLRQCSTDIETLEEISYNYQAALTAFLPPRRNR